MSRLRGDLETEVARLKEEKRQLELHLLRTDAWSKHLGKWTASISESDVCCCFVTELCHLSFERANTVFMFLCACVRCRLRKARKSHDSLLLFVSLLHMSLDARRPTMRRRVQRLSVRTGSFNANRKNSKLCTRSWPRFERAFVITVMFLLICTCSYFCVFTWAYFLDRSTLLWS